MTAVVAIIASFSLLVVLTGCGSEGAVPPQPGSTDTTGPSPLTLLSPSSPPSPTSGATSFPASAILLDVRTAEEFAEGHLSGAVNLDVNAADFYTRIAELDRGVSYLLYCRSGNRSAQAVARLQAAGFTEVFDLGSKEAAAVATGREMVR